MIQSRSAATTFSSFISPQNQALDWILSDTYFSDGLLDDRLLQQFALVTLYYSKNGANWSHGGWLESQNECNWYNGFDFSCSQESMVEELRLNDDNLSGLIPVEIGLLTQITALYLHDNKLTGSLPSELGLLTKLSNFINLTDYPYVLLVLLILAVLLEVARDYSSSNELLQSKCIAFQDGGNDDHII